MCTFCNGNHLVVNWWKKNGYPPHFNSKFSKANSVMSYEEMEDQDFLEQNYHCGEVQYEQQIQQALPTTTQSFQPTVFSAEQIAQIAQIIKSQTTKPTTNTSYVASARISIQEPVSNPPKMQEDAYTNPQVDLSQIYSYCKSIGSGKRIYILSNSWILDTGASSHIANSMHDFVIDRKISN